MAILMFFEERYHKLIRNPGVDRKRGWKYVVYIAIHYIISITFILPCFLNIPDQNLGKLMIMEVSLVL